MIKKIALLSALYLISSCATITHNSNYNLQVSGTPNSQVKVNDSVYNLPAKVLVDRSKSDLSLAFISDSISKDYSLKSRLNPTFKYGNIALGPLLFAGYAIDLTNDKKYYYGKSIFLDGSENSVEQKISSKEAIANFKTNSAQYFKREFRKSKGQINLTLSIPWANHFYFKPTNERTKSSFGFLGISGGIEYYHTDKKFLNLNAIAATDFGFPIPVPLDRDGEAESLSAFSISLTENHQYNRSTFGYGFQYANNRYSFENNEYETDTNLREPYTQTNNVLGLVVNSYFQLSKSFNIGLNYKPTLYNLDLSQFQYEHLISLDLAWKIRLRK